MSSLKSAPTCRYTAVPITIHQAKYLAHTLALRDPDGIRLPENQRDQLIASLESRLTQGQTHQTHFSIRFQIKA